MQQTILNQSPPALVSMAGLAKAIAMPHEYAPQRFPSFPALERTAVMGFNYNSLLNVGNNTRGLLVRDPVYPFWAEVLQPRLSYGIVYRPDCKVIGAEGGTTPNPVRSTFEYEMLDQLTTVTIGNQVGVVGNTNCSITIVGATAPTVGLAIVGYDLFTDRPNSGFVYLPNGYALNCIAVFAAAPMTTSTGGAATLRVELDRWMGKGKTERITGPHYTTDPRIQIGIATTCAGVAVAGLPEGWYRVSDLIVTMESGPNLPTFWKDTDFAFYAIVTNGAATFTAASKTLEVSAGTNVGLLPLASSKEYLTSVAPWQDTKVTAVSVLATNVTKVLNKEGTVLAGRITPRTGPIWGFIPQVLETLHPAEKAYMGLEQGFYTYAPPSGDMVEFTSHLLLLAQSYPVQTPTGGTLNTLPVYALHNTSFANAMVFQDPDAGTSLALNVDWHVEFRNNSVLFPIGMSTITLEQYHQAQIAISAMGFFFGNETHAERIKRLAKTIVGWAGKLAPAVSVVNPVIGKGMQVASDLILGTKPSSSVVPTTVPVATLSAPKQRSSSVSSVNSTSSRKKVVVAHPLSKAQRKRLRKQQQQKTQ